MVSLLIPPKHLLFKILISISITSSDIIWSNTMDSTIPSTWLKTGTGTIIPQTFSLCPGTTNQCWHGSDNFTLTKQQTIDTLNFQNILLTYSISTATLNGPDQCSIQYSTNGANSTFTNIVTITAGDSNQDRSDEIFSTWNPAADANIHGIKLQLFGSGAGTNCFYSDFTISGDVITTAPTTNTPTNNPITFSPTINPTTSIPSYNPTTFSPTNATITPTFNPTTFISTSSQTNMETTPSLTVSPLVVGYLQVAAGGRMNISQEYCTWNVSRLLYVINDTDPDFLYDPSTVVLIPQFLPVYIIQQFPPNLLKFYGLNYTADTSEGCYDAVVDSNVTIPPFGIDLCVGPLLKTDLVNPINEDAEVRRINLKNVTGVTHFVNTSLAECGLKCKEGAEIYGLNANEQNMVDSWKIIGCSLCFLAICFLAVNQYVDQLRGGKRCCDKPLLQIIPYIITASLFSLVFLMTVGEMAGKENILCKYNDIAEELEFSFYSPFFSKNMPCTVHGLCFYTSLLVFCFYTVLLSFVIFRQFYAPMSPYFHIRQRWWHIFVLAFVMLIDVASIVTSSYGAIWPMGVCLPGPSQQNKLLAFTVTPIAASCAFSFLFQVASTYLLQKELIRQSRFAANDASANKIEDLLKRLLLYGIGILSCLALLTATASSFYAKAPHLKARTEASIECQLEQILLNPEKICERTHAISPFWFLSWIICAILGVLSQTILACHNEARNRLKRVGNSIKLKSMKSVSGSPVVSTDEQPMDSTSNIFHQPVSQVHSQLQPGSPPIRNPGITITATPAPYTHADTHTHEHAAHRGHRANVTPMVVPAPPQYMVENNVNDFNMGNINSGYDGGNVGYDGGNVGYGGGFQYTGGIGRRDGAPGVGNSGLVELAIGLPPPPPSYQMRGNNFME